MKKSIISIVFLYFILSVTGQQKAQQFDYNTKTTTMFDQNRLNRIDSVMNQWVQSGQLPQAITFVAKNGQVVHYKAYGWRNMKNKISLQKNDIFRMASQTKAITSVALLILMEERKVLLDDPVKKYIPEFAHPQVLLTFNSSDSSYTSRPAKRDITIRNLLTHTTGISYGNNETRKIYDKAGVPTSPMMSKDNITLGEAVKRLAQCPLEHDPGDKFTYGMSVDVLGYLIEVVSGMSIDEYFRTKIFEPLGMTDTYFYIPDNKKDRLVTLYSKNAPNEPISVNMKENGLYQTLPYSGAKTFFSTGAGLNGTIEDYAKFCQMILNGGEFNGVRLLSRKTVEMMNKNEVGDFRGVNGYGLAYEVIRSGSGKSIISDGAVSWGGWFNTDYVIDPAENMILLFYTNTEPMNTEKDIKAVFRNLVYQALK